MTSLDASSMNHFLKFLVIGFMIIGLIMLSDISISASAQNQTAGENMAGGGNQNMTAQATSEPNSMVAGNQSSAGGAADPGYVQLTSTRQVNASADQVLEYFMNIRLASLSS